MTPGDRSDENLKTESVISVIRDESRWDHMAPEQLAKLLAEGLIFYGGSGDESMVNHLVPLYLRVKQVCEFKQRKEVFDDISDICDRNPDWFNALFSFLLLDDDRAIVSTAALDLAMYIPGGHDGLEGVRRLIGHIQRNEVDNHGAAFGGLLFLGDARVCELLKPLREDLTDEDVRAAMKCRTGFMFDATMEFLIDWLELLPADSNDAKFGEIASELFLTTEQSVKKTVQKIKRNFGARGTVPRVQLISETPLDEFGRQYAVRLYSLETREAAPKVMSAVLRAWGLNPRAPRSQQALPPH